MTGATWRYFGTREVHLARAWAAAGGVAVHENPFRLRGHRTAHLLAANEAELLEAARAVGCRDEWIQRTRTLHFDLILEALEAALMNCGVDPARPPARRVWSSRDEGVTPTGHALFFRRPRTSSE